MVFVPYNLLTRIKAPHFPVFFSSRRFIDHTKKPISPQDQNFVLDVDKANYQVSFENVILSRYEFYEFTISSLSLLVAQTTHEAQINYNITIANYGDNSPSSPVGPGLFKSLRL